MNNDMVGYLQNRIKETRADIEALQKRIAEATAENNLLVSELQGYERTLNAELRRQGLQFNEPGASVQLPLAGDDHHEESSNKTDFAWQTIFKRGETGTTTDELYKAFAAAGIQVRKPYLYSILMRLREKQKIRARRGKYYPTVEFVGSDNGKELRVN